MPVDGACVHSLWNQSINSDPIDSACTAWASVSQSEREQNFWVHESFCNINISWPAACWLPVANEVDVSAHCAGLANPGFVPPNSQSIWCRRHSVILRPTLRVPKKATWKCSDCDNRKWAFSTTLITTMCTTRWHSSIVAIAVLKHEVSPSTPCIWICDPLWMSATILGRQKNLRLISCLSKGCHSHQVGIGSEMLIQHSILITIGLYYEQ